MKKVMHLIHAMNTGGAETLVKEYVLKLDKKKFEVVLLCFYHCPDSPYEKILFDNNIRVIYLDDEKISTKNIFSKIFKLIRRYMLIKKFIKIEKPDILHTHLQLNSYVLFAKTNKNCKLFHTVHSDPQKLWMGSFKKKIDLKCAKYLVKNKKMQLIVLHDEMKKKVDEMFKINNSVVLKNGIDFERFNVARVKDRRKFRNELGISESAFVVGHIGRLSKVKNQTFIIDIFEKLLNENKNAFLLLIGDGNEKASLEEKINKLNLKEKCLILSNRSDIPDLLNIMDIFVFPSLYEGLPIVLIETQKMNVPCFISDAVPPAAIISNLVNVISLKKNSEEWKNIIIKYNKPKIIEINDKEWDMKQVIKRLESIYEE